MTTPLNNSFVLPDLALEAVPGSFRGAPAPVA